MYGNRGSVTTFKKHRRRATDLGIGLLSVVFGSVVSGSGVSTNYIHRRRDHRVCVVDVIDDLHPPSLDRVIDWRQPIRIVRWRQFLVDP